MKLIAYYSIYNEADFILRSLRSVAPYADRVIIIEGAWKETYMVNGKKYSDDGTVKMIKAFAEENPHVEVYFRNEDTQLEQRTAVFNYLPRDEPFLLWLVDGDEVYEIEQAERVAFEAKKGSIVETRTFVYTFESLIFVNDFFNYSPVRYPRLFRIMPQCESDSYEFIEPNHIARNGFPLNDKTEDTDIRFFHYSYCHSPERFQEKKRERTRLHGNFAWELRDGLVSRDDATILPFEGKHPEVMKSHPLFGVKKHKKVAKKETIVYVEHSGIGNLILATPMLQALRFSNPHAKIHVVTWNRAARILDGVDFVDSIVRIEDQGCMTQFISPGGSAIDGYAIDHLLISPVGAIDRVVAMLGYVSKKVHKLQRSGLWTQHEVDVKMQLARRLGYRGPTPKCEVKLFEYNRINAIGAFPEYEEDPAPMRWVAIDAAYLKDEHWYKKHWGDTEFAQLIDMIHEEYPELGFVFVGGPQDKGDADRIISQTVKVPFEFVINRCGYSDDIKDTGKMLSGTVLCIGNDGGLQHIAAAVGTPTVTIFTFTNPVKNRPFYADLTNKRGKVVMKPCGKRLMCQHGNHESCECLEVPIQPVFKAVSEMLQEVLNG